MVDDGGDTHGTTGAGLFKIVVAPFRIAYRCGIHVFALICAGLATFYAILSPQLTLLIEHLSHCGRTCRGWESAERLILELDQIAWWEIAAGAWLLAVLCWVVGADKRMPSDGL